MAHRRKIFEEVGKPSGPAAPLPKPPQEARDFRRQIRIWLVILIISVVAAVVVGGTTRLTDSGLAITAWNPVAGALPPFDASDWQAEFEKYQKIPEFTLQNFSMSLAEFKTIYWWEWSHRQVGRLVGLVWAAGFVLFALRKAMPPQRFWRLFGVGALIGIQGGIGWWMVASGLAGQSVDVAPYRLAMHLGLAFAILGLTFWEFLLLGREQHEIFQARRVREHRLAAMTGWFIGLIVLQLLAGALVAGNDAGRAFPTWPTMNGEFFPSEGFSSEPLLSNFVNNPALVQFNHRTLGYLTAIFAVAVWWKSRASGRPATRRAFDLLLALTIAQTVLGIVAALLAAAPAAAILHQFGAVLLFAAALWTRFSAMYPAIGLRR